MGRRTSKLFGWGALLAGPMLFASSCVVEAYGGVRELFVDFYHDDDDCCGWFDDDDDDFEDDLEDFFDDVLDWD